MTTAILGSVFLFLLGTVSVFGQATFEKDIVDTSAGKVEITFIGHGSLVFAFSGRTIHVDPFGQLTDYSRLPKADLVLITHDHQDHLDQKALEAVRSAKTLVIVAQSCADKVAGATAMKNGDVRTETGIGIEAIPAYNLVNKRPDGQPFHPKGQGNGYILTFGDKRVYVAGDTENTPEMKALKGIDVAFLPMNLPYTMTPEMVADAAKGFMPKVLHPYHYGETDPARLTVLLKDTPQVEVRIRKMK